MMFIDPDKGSDDVADTPGTQGHVDDDDDANAPDTHGYANDDFAIVERAVDESAHLGDHSTAAEAREIVAGGRAPPLAIFSSVGCFITPITVLRMLTISAISLGEPRP